MTRLLAIAVLVLVAATLAVSSAPNAGIRADRAVRAGGVNSEPSMRPWRYRGANPDGWWCPQGGCVGVKNGTAFVAREIPLAAALGVRTIRAEFPWALMEPRRGKYDWRRADYIVRLARSAHVLIQPVVVWTPRWAGATANTPPRAADFARFMRAMAKRFRGRISYYELWNEPDLERYWAGTVQQYVTRVLRPGFRAIRAADPRARVILGGPSKVDPGWFDDVYRYGGGSSFDIAAYHAYVTAPTVLAEARIVLDALSRHGQSKKPIWVGEYGYPEAATSAPAQEAMIRAVLTGDGPVAMAQWYSLRDTLTATCCPPKTLDESSWGLLTKAYERKSSYTLMQTLLRAR